MTERENPILEIRDLKVHFKVHEGLLKAVDGVDLTLSRGESLGLIGESGCGKSVAMQSLLRLEPPYAEVSGQILLHRSDDETVDIMDIKQKSREMRDIRWDDIAMIFQEPMKAFSPVYTVGNQIIEALLLHRTKDKAEAREIAISLLKKVGISNPEQRIDQYPHQLSGGMRQRVMIAMALSCTPTVLIADEPTTALDVTVQAEVLELILSLQQEFGISMIFITHDLGVIAEVSDNVAVMYLGKIVEKCDVDTLFHDPKHPYTIALLKSVPEITKTSRTELSTIEGSVPIPLNTGEGCGFSMRCPHMIKGLCEVKTPEMTETSPGHYVRCFLLSDDMETEANK